jgi:hypothetical protein
MIIVVHASDDAHANNDVTVQSDDVVTFHEDTPSSAAR